MANVKQLTCLSLSTFPSAVITVCRGPPTRNSRFTRQNFISSIPILIRFFESNGTRANDRQISLKDVQKLRQLIQRRMPQYATNSRNARVIVELLFPLPNLKLQGCQVFLWTGMCVSDHSSYLENVNWLTKTTHALLAEKRRSWRIDTDCKACNSHRYDQHNANESAENNIETAFNSKIQQATFFGCARSLTSQGSFICAPRHSIGNGGTILNSKCCSRCRVINI